MRALLADRDDHELRDFPSVVRACAHATGIPVKRIVANSTYMAILARVLVEADPSSPFVRSGRFRGLHRRLSETLRELHEFGFGPGDLEDAAEKAEGDLADRARALADVDRRAREVVERVGFGFLSDVIERCTAENEKPLRLFSRIVIFAGSEKRPLHCRFVDWLVSRGLEVHLLVEHVPGREDLFEGAHWLFQRFEQYPMPPEEMPWYATLFSEEPVRDVPEVELVSAPDPLTETEWALRTCLAAMSGGVMPHRIAIYARDPEAYRPLVIACAARLGVPVHVGMAMPLLSVGFAGFVRDVLKSFADSDVRALERIIGSSYLGLSTEERDQWREAVRSAATERTFGWEVLMAWVESEAPPSTLTRILSWRAMFLDQPRRLEQWHELLQGFLAESGVGEHVAHPESSTEERDLRAQTALLRSLGDAALADQGTERRLDFGEFVRLAERLWSDETTFAPGQDNAVVFGRLEDLGSVEVLIVLGLLEGIMPRRRKEDPILLDEHRKALSAMRPGRPELLDSHARARGERDVFVRLCATPSWSLHLFYPRAGEDRDNVPAFYLEEIRRKLGTRLKERVLSREDVVPSKGAGLSAVDVELRRALSQPREAFPKNGLVTEAARALVRAPLREGVDIDEFYRYGQCPFRAAFRYRLGVFPPVRDRWVHLHDLALRACLPEAPDPEEAERRLRKQLERILVERAPELDPLEERFIRLGGERLIKAYIEREFAARRIWPRASGSSAFRVLPGEHGLCDGLRRGEERIAIRSRTPLAALHRIGPYAVLQLYQVGEVERIPGWHDEKRRVEALRYYPYLVVLRGCGSAVGLEVETQGGKRTLILLGPEDEAPRGASEELGLTIERLGDELLRYLREGYDTVFKKVVDAMEKGSIAAKPGEHCRECPYGELCRRSSEFSEREDNLVGIGEDE